MNATTLPPHRARAVPRRRPLGTPEGVGLPRGVFTLLAALSASCAERPLIPPPPPPLPPASPAPASVATEARSDAGAAALPRPLTTDEGMWLLNDFPSD